MARSYRATEIGSHANLTFVIINNSHAWGWLEWGDEMLALIAHSVSRCVTTATMPHPLVNAILWGGTPGQTIPRDTMWCSNRGNYRMVHGKPSLSLRIGIRFISISGTCKVVLCYQTNQYTIAAATRITTGKNLCAATHNTRDG